MRLERAAAAFCDALAELERAAISAALTDPRPGIRDLLVACRQVRESLSESTTTPMTAARAAAIRANMAAGRRKAHEMQRAAAARRDGRLRRDWRLYLRSGYGDSDILDELAERYGVQRSTVRRRARRLKLLRDA